MPLDRRMDKDNVVHLHNEYYTAEKNGILKFVGKWIELENIILSEVTQTERQISYVLTHKWPLDIKQRKPVYNSQSQIF